MQPVEAQARARIGSWNKGDFDGWFLGDKNPALELEVAKDDGTEGAGCLIIHNSTNWSMAVTTESWRPELVTGRRIQLDVFARKVGFRSGWLKVGVSLQSEQTPWDELGYRMIEFDKWQTLVFEYDRKQHKMSNWSLINIITMADDEGAVLIDNVWIK